jgi:ribose 5-phosphate isomerase A
MPLVPAGAHAKARAATGGSVREDMSDDLKRRAAEAALAYVEDGMRLGLGSGTTATQFVHLLGQRVKEGLKVVGVPTSSGTAKLARDLGIPLTTLDETPELDLDIDGADEIGPGLALIKGGGGCLLHEKIVANACRRMIVIADERKRVDVLGAFPLPLEVLKFGMTSTWRTIERAVAELEPPVTLKLRQDGGAPYVTDEGNHIIDASFGRIPDPEALANRLASIPGVVEHGLFLGFADLALIASPQGVSETEA